MTLQERLADVFPPPHERGLQARLARACGVSRPTVSAWFNNPDKVASISREHAEIICAEMGLEVSPAWLAEGKKPKSSRAGLGQTTPILAGQPLTTLPAFPDIHYLISNLGQRLRTLTKSQREVALSILHGLVEEPLKADHWAAMLEVLLGGENNSPARKQA